MVKNPIARTLRILADGPAWTRLGDLQQALGRDARAAREAIDLGLVETRSERGSTRGKPTTLVRLSLAGTRAHLESCARS